VPAAAQALLLLAGEEVGEAALVHLARLLGADNADLVVAAAEPAARVADRVDVQPRRRGLARERAQALRQLLLQLVGQVVLRAEEDDAALRDWEWRTRRLVR
jgi:hypothetical protein